MKVKTACKVCGKRAKRLPLKMGLSLCTKHYKQQDGQTNT